MKVSDFMSTKVIFVPPSTPIRKVMELLIEKKISGVPIVDKENRLLGLVTEGDILASESLTVSLMDGREPLLKIDTEPVEKIMKRQVITIEPEAHLTKACGLINVYRFKRLPVVDAHRQVVGILSRRDVIRAML